MRTVGEITVRLQPRAKRTEIDRAGVAPGRVQVVRGASSRDKVVRVEGVEDRALRAARESGR